MKQSFLSKYPVEVRNNRIDRRVFRHVEGGFREAYGIGDRFMILGVASPWSERKGLEDFIRLRGMLDDSFAIVVVGLTGKQVKRMPRGILALEKTKSKEELAEIYSAADVFFNPTREDNYPTVNLEAEACGTPVVTFDTGGCGETLGLKESRVVANLNAAKSAINNMMIN